MTEGLRHVVHRRVHLERSQPQARRARVGTFLEKKRDYKLRAERYHVLERRIRDLAGKARFRNEDEFNFKMVHGRLGEDGAVVLPSSSTVASRRLNSKDKFRRSLAELDRNRFVLQHRAAVKDKRARAVVTDCASLLMDSGKHVTFDDSSSSGDEEAASVSDVGGSPSAHPGRSSGDASDSSMDSEASPLKTTAGSRRNPSTAGGKSAAPPRTRLTRATRSVQEHLKTVGETLEAKREDERLRQCLEAERDLRVALHQKRQVRRVKGSNVRVFPFERQK
ncbi:U3 small nucleolar RNA-associated protein 11 [Babesia caballi]|uniref:U3 small nucleolar RNA-associated protein 11 n=1 Tax=Babesia caballi TaxID=5871 RepID=A0AAV4M1H4_BABCB|nr:U3 small nucleolar RNA-associated protein 11 [Babesia caballi]